MCATLVLGVVAIIHPIKIADFSPFAAARIFMIISTVFFLFSIKTEKRISRKEGIVLVGVYIVYLLTEIFIKYF